MSSTPNLRGVRAPHRQLPEIQDLLDQWKQIYDASASDNMGARSEVTTVRIDIANLTAKIERERQALIDGYDAARRAAGDDWDEYEYGEAVAQLQDKLEALIAEKERLKADIKKNVAERERKRADLEQQAEHIIAYVTTQVLPKIERELKNKGNRSPKQQELFAVAASHSRHTRQSAPSQQNDYEHNLTIMGAASQDIQAKAVSTAYMAESSLGDTPAGIDAKWRNVNARIESLDTALTFLEKHMGNESLGQDQHAAATKRFNELTALRGYAVHALNTISDNRKSSPIFQLAANNSKIETQVKAMLGEIQSGQERYTPGQLTTPRRKHGFNIRQAGVQLRDHGWNESTISTMLDPEWERNTELRTGIGGAVGTLDARDAVSKIQAKVDSLQHLDEQIKQTEGSERAGLERTRRTRVTQIAHLLGPATQGLGGVQDPDERKALELQLQGAGGRVAKERDQYADQERLAADHAEALKDNKARDREKDSEEKARKRRQEAAETQGHTQEWREMEREKKTRDAMLGRATSLTDKAEGMLSGYQTGEEGFGRSGMLSSYRRAMGAVSAIGDPDKQAELHGRLASLQEHFEPLAKRDYVDGENERLDDRWTGLHSRMAVGDYHVGKGNDREAQSVMGGVLGDIRRYMAQLVEIQIEAGRELGEQSQEYADFTKTLNTRFEAAQGTHEELITRGFGPKEPQNNPNNLSFLQKILGKTAQGSLLSIPGVGGIAHALLGEEAEQAGHALGGWARNSAAGAGIAKAWNAPTPWAAGAEGAASTAGKMTLTSLLGATVGGVVTRGLVGGALTGLAAEVTKSLGGAARNEEIRWANVGNQMGTSDRLLDDVRVRNAKHSGNGRMATDFARLNYTSGELAAYYENAGMGGLAAGQRRDGALESLRLGRAYGLSTEESGKLTDTFMRSGDRNNVDIQGYARETALLLAAAVKEGVGSPEMVQALSGALSAAQASSGNNLDASAAQGILDQLRAGNEQGKNYTVGASGAANVKNFNEAIANLQGADLKWMEQQVIKGRTGQQLGLTGDNAATFDNAWKFNKFDAIQFLNLKQPGRLKADTMDAINVTAGGDPTIRSRYLRHFGQNTVAAIEDSYGPGAMQDPRNTPLARTLAGRPDFKTEAERAQAMRESQEANGPSQVARAQQYRSEEGKQVASNLFFGNNLGQAVIQASDTAGMGFTSGAKILQDKVQGFYPSAYKEGRYAQEGQERVGVLPEGGWTALSTNNLQGRRQTAWSTPTPRSAQSPFIGPVWAPQTTAQATEQAAATAITLQRLGPVQGPVWTPPTAADRKRSALLDWQAPKAPPVKAFGAMTAEEYVAAAQGAPGDVDISAAAARNRPDPATTRRAPWYEGAVNGLGNAFMGAGTFAFGVLNGVDRRAKPGGTDPLSVALETQADLQAEKRQADKWKKTQMMYDYNPGQNAPELAGMKRGEAAKQLDRMIEQNERVIRELEQSRAEKRVLNGSMNFTNPMRGGEAGEGKTFWQFLMGKLGLGGGQPGPAGTGGELAPNGAAVLPLGMGANQGKLAAVTAQFMSSAYSGAYNECSVFIRQMTEAAVGQKLQGQNGGPRLFGASATATVGLMKAAGLTLTKEQLALAGGLQPGDIPYRTTDVGGLGHLGMVDQSGKYIVENSNVANGGRGGKTRTAINRFGGYEGVIRLGLDTNGDFKGDGGVYQGPAAPRGGVPGVTRPMTFMESLHAQESKSSGSYTAVNDYSGALGKYQVMPQNLTGAWNGKPAKAKFGWDWDALGRDLTPAQFLADPAAQEKIAQFQLDKYYKQQLAGARGNATVAAERTARWWYSNNPNPSDVRPTRMVNGKAVPTGPSPNQYAREVLARMVGSRAAPGAPLSAAPSGILKVQVSGSVDVGGKPSVKVLSAIEDVVAARARGTMAAQPAVGSHTRPG